MKVFYFDTETSGLDPYRHGILTLSALIEIDGEVVDEFDLCARPDGLMIDEKALEINGLTVEQIMGFPSRAEFLIDLKDRLAIWVDKYDKKDKMTPCGYNCHFDYAMLGQEFARQGDKYFGSWFDHTLLDPMMLINLLRYFGIFGELHNRKLVTMAKYFGLDTEGAHDAKSDLHMLRGVMRKLMERVSYDETGRGL